MSPAIEFPKKIIPKDFNLFKPRRDAIRDPIQTPVPGSGMATKRKSPKYSYLTIWPLFLSALFLAQDTYFSNLGFFCIQSNIGMIHKSMGMEGRVDPKKLIK